MVKNILIVGVGGQGTLLASKLMGRILLDEGHDVKVSEVHGMSQRGGSVVTYVRYGSEVFSTVIDRGEADIIISFEALESARWLSYLKPGGVIITSVQEIMPMPVITGAAEYPENLIGKINDKGVKTVPVPAAELATDAGNIRSVNLVLLGVAAKYMDIDKQKWIETIKVTVPAKTIDTNIKAFENGYNL